MKNKPSFNDVFRKTVDVYETAASPNQGRDFLATPLANQFIDWIHDLNYMRQIARPVKMTTQTLTYPRLLSGPKVYFQATEGATGNYTNITTDNLVLTAKKFMSLIRFSTEVLEDAAFDMAGIVKSHFAAKFADCEEETMMIGNPSYGTTTATEADETATTWYTKSHKLAFWGILSYLYNNTPHGAAHVNAGGADMDVPVIREAIYKMGKYGRVYDNIICVLNPWSGSQLIGSTYLMTLDKYGPNATIFTGEIGKLYGKIRVIVSPYCGNPGVATGEGMMFHKENLILGDRRLYSLKTAEWIDDDIIKMAMTARLDFKWERTDAMVYIHNLKGTSALAS